MRRAGNSTLDIQQRLQTKDPFLSMVTFTIINPKHIYHWMEDYESQMQLWFSEKITTTGWIAMKLFLVAMVFLLAPSKKRIPTQFFCK